MYLRFRAKLEKLEAISTIFEGLGKVRKIRGEFCLYLRFRAKLEKLDSHLTILRVREKLEKLEGNFAYI